MDLRGRSCLTRRLPEAFVVASDAFVDDGT
jgi:hypothetical protein